MPHLVLCAASAPIRATPYANNERHCHHRRECSADQLKNHSRSILARIWDATITVCPSLNKSAKLFVTGLGAQPRVAHNRISEVSSSKKGKKIFKHDESKLITSAVSRATIFCRIEAIYI
mmetsp:Transcript_48421/g.101155  ORF Transcript_48421/g.101155 Transcript_48421/m.101155 type:complete len:120 (-) Transcript_48421:5-364(-)